MDNNKNQIKIDVPMAAVLVAIVIIVCVVAISQVKKGNGRELNGSLVQHEVGTNNQPVVESGTNYEMIGDNLIVFPYGETSKEENGIKVIVFDDGNISLSGTADKDAVVFRLVSKDDIVEYPLDNKKYVFRQGVPKQIFSSHCRIDIGLTRQDGTKEIFNTMKNSIGNGEDIVIDNSDGEYVGIHAISLYVVGGFMVPDGYIFSPELVEIR